MLPTCSRAAAEALPAGWRWAGLVAIPLCLAPLIAASGVWTLGWICHATLVMTWAGLLLPSRRLLAATLPMSLSINVLWTTDAISTMCGVPISGLTAHLADPTLPLPERIAPWFHALHPIAMVLVIRRIGYHPHGLWWAMGLTTGIILGLRLAVILRLLPDGINPTWVVPERGWDLPAWLDSWLYSAFQIMCIGVGMILPVHLMLQRLFRPAPVTAQPPAQRADAGPGAG